MLLSPTDGLAATINPTTNNLELELGASQVETVTVTIPANAGVNKADVYLLADTTQSMSGILNAVQREASKIVGAPYDGVDIAFGVGNYRDFPETNPPFIHQCALTANKDKVTAEIDTWKAEGGADVSEAQLFALHALAERPAGPQIGWRTDSKRIIVWFGDAPGHDPICAALTGLGFDITEEAVRNRLAEEGITVIAISVNGDGLDKNPAVSSRDYRGICAIGGNAGQATRIAGETGGQHVTDINSTQIVETIINLIESSIRDIGEVKLSPSPSIAPFVNSISPASFNGLAGEEAHVLNFRVNCRGALPCIDTDATHNGSLNAVADGAVIASQSVQVTVPHCNPVRLTRFVLVNAETNQDIRILQNNDVIDITSMRSALNVRVEAGNGVKSVTFKMTPHHPLLRGEENRRPFSLFGDNDSGAIDYNEGFFEAGMYTITVTPFPELRAQGVPGEPLSVTFEVVD